MSDPARDVISGIVPGRVDRLQEAMQRLEPGHFRSQELRNVFEMLRRYCDVTGAVLPHRQLEDLLRRQQVDPAKALYYSELFRDLEQQDVPDDQFRWGLDSLRDQRSQELTGQMVTTAFEILERGWTDPDTGDVLKGHGDARKYLWREMAEVDRLGQEEFAPEGDIRTEGEAVHREYADRKAGKGPGFVKTGIPSLDLVTSGVQAGEIWLVCAYTGEGKSMLVTQSGWYGATQEGKNVFFATAEVTRAQARRRIVARHSRLPEFGLPEGLNSSGIKMGTLSEAQEEAMWRVTEDLASNDRYGRIHLAQVPRAGTLGQVEAKMRRAQSLWQVDLVIIDYLMLLRSDRRRRESRDELNDVLRETKAIATGFNAGAGVPIITPWPMSKDAYRRALLNGSYQISDLGETSEAEKSSDVVISMLRLPEEPNKVHVQVLKNREGALPKPFVLEADFRSTYLVERTEDSTEDLLELD